MAGHGANHHAGLFRKSVIIFKQMGYKLNFRVCRRSPRCAGGLRAAHGFIAIYIFMAFMAFKPLMTLLTFILCKSAMFWLAMFWFFL